MATNLTQIKCTSYSTTTTTTSTSTVCVIEDKPPITSGMHRGISVTVLIFRVDYAGVLTEVFST